MKRHLILSLLAFLFFSLTLYGNEDKIDSSYNRASSRIENADSKLGKRLDSFFKKLEGEEPTEENPPSAPVTSPPVVSNTQSVSAPSSVNRLVRVERKTFSYFGLYFTPGVGYAIPKTTTPHDEFMVGLLGYRSASLKGVGISGLYGIVEGDFWGLKHAGLLSVIGGDVRGCVHSGLVTYMPKGGVGVFASGLATISSKVDGLVCSGLFNYTWSGVDGLQIATFNYSPRVVGGQIGVINVAKKIKGVQIGVLNFCSNIEGFQVGVATKNLDYSKASSLALYHVGKVKFSLGCDSKLNLSLAVKPTALVWKGDDTLYGSFGITTSDNFKGVHLAMGGGWELPTENFLGYVELLGGFGGYSLNSSWDVFYYNYVGLQTLSLKIGTGLKTKKRSGFAVGLMATGYLTEGDSASWVNTKEHLVPKLNSLIKKVGSYTIVPSLFAEIRF